MTIKSFSTSFVLLFAFAFCAAQEIIKKEITSYDTGDTREVLIYIPKGYEEDVDKLYPLTVVLDAEYLFDTYVGNSKMFAYMDKAPDQVIVGVLQNQYKDQRYVDCMYSKTTSLPEDTSDNFYRFVRGDLLDFMEANYRLSPFKTIVGNTISGNFTNYFLIEDRPAFNAIISINPSLAPDISPLIDQKTSSIREDDIVYYYICNGDYNSERRASAITSLNGVLSSKNSKGFQYKYRIFEDTTRPASTGQAIPDALGFIFDTYSAISREEYDKNVKNLKPVDAIAYLENKYTDIEYLFGSNLKIRERDIYAIEGIIIDQENGDYLKDFGEMILNLYEESPLGNYYIGMYYEKGKSYKRALKNYRDGFIKLEESSQEESDGFYQNIERVLQKQKMGDVEEEEENLDEENPEE